MNQQFASGATLLLSLALSTMAFSSTRASSSNACLPANDAYARDLTAYVRRFVTTDRAAAARAGMGLPRMDSLGVSAVDDEKKCKQAIKTIRKTDNLSDAHLKSVYVVKMDSLFWVEDPSRTSGEFRRAFVLSSDLEKIVARPMR